jgi:hypothetical protein
MFPQDDAPIVRVAGTCGVCGSPRTLDLMSLFTGRQRAIRCTNPACSESNPRFPIPRLD